jgi:hypothetical protein
MGTEYRKIFAGCQLHHLVQISQYFGDLTPSTAETLVDLNN